MMSQLPHQCRAIPCIPNPKINGSHGITRSLKLACSPGVRYKITLEAKMNLRLKLLGLSRGIILATMLTTALFAVGQVETIDAIVRGTSTQMGKQFNVKISFNQFSTPQDKETLKNAFQTGGHDALVKALEKMKEVGRLRLPSNTGYSIAYAVATPTPTGRKIRFITNRPIAFAESRNMTRSKQYDLTAGEFEINDQDKSKSTGVLYPMAKIGLNKDGEVQFELYQNPWQLTDIVDWTKAKE